MTPESIPTYQILTNLDCNLRCHYCYEKDKTRGANDIDAVRNFIDVIIADMRNKKDTDRTTIEFIGGETFLHMDLLQQAMDYFVTELRRHQVQSRYTLGFTTNGTLFHKKDVQDFLKQFAPYMVVGFSIDGTKAVHDAHRVDAAGNGTYDRAVEGYRICREYIPDCRLYVKATFSHDTIDAWEASMLNLIALGFKRISGNVVYEEDWTEEDYPKLASQMTAIADYLVDNHLLDTLFIDQLNRGGLPIHFPILTTCESNYCGSCKYMRCLGFENNIYGCQKFAQIPHVPPIGHLDREGIHITNQKLVDEVAGLFKYSKKECGDCAFLPACSTCVAEPYIRGESPEAYYRRRTYCGFTAAMMFARWHLVERLLGKENASGRPKTPPVCPAAEVCSGNSTVTSSVTTR